MNERRLCRHALLLTLIFQSCGPNSTASRPAEAWDDANAPDLFRIKSLKFEDLIRARATHGLLSKKPWMDDYWPDYFKGIASRYVSGETFKSFGEQKANAMHAGAQNYLLSPAEKYDVLRGDDSMSLTRDSWVTYREDLHQLGDKFDDWGWMGICDGWAPAAYREPAATRHILASMGDGDPILFFAGDIRGLISKVYAVNEMTKDVDTIGIRCDLKKKDIILDKSGRPVDGYFSDRRGFNIVKDDWRTLGVVEIRSRSKQNSPEHLWLVNADGPSDDEPTGGEFKVFVYTDRKLVGRDVRENRLGRNARDHRGETVTLQRSCRDMNPGSMHIALARLISDQTPEDGKEGFVMEMERAEEIWNYPIWGFSSEIGDPKGIDEDDDDLRIFRAPGTRRIVPVQTTIVFIAEPDSGQRVPASRARFEYPDEFDVKIDWEHLADDDDRYSYETYDYTLELDDKGYIIGGEWENDSKELSSAVDFIWRVNGKPTDKDAENGNDSVIRYSIVRKLLKCSVNGQDEDDMVVRIHGKNQTISAVKCKIRSL